MRTRGLVLGGQTGHPVSCVVTQDPAICMHSVCALHHTGLCFVQEECKYAKVACLFVCYRFEKLIYRLATISGGSDDDGLRLLQKGAMLGRV